MKNKKYQIIYADPPWRYKCTRKTAKNKGGAAEHHYPTMSHEELCNTLVPSAKDAFLFMWVTNAKLLEGLDLIDKWGFKFINVAFTWVKQNKSGVGFKFGTGYYTRGSTEMCLLAKKGKPQVKSHKVRALVIERIREHSRKPDCVRDRIVELCGDVPRIELFARTKIKGWDVWGNQTDKFTESKVSPGQEEGL